MLRPDEREGASHGRMKEAHSRQRNSECKGPEVGTGLAR